MRGRTGPSSPVAVVLVDSAVTHLRYLRAVLHAMPGCEVVGEARSGVEAVALVERLAPTVVVVDLDLRDGLGTVEAIMARCPTPVVGYTSAGGAGEEALAAGAVAVLPGPWRTARGGPATVGLAEFATSLRDRVGLASRVKVITHPRARLRAGAGSAQRSAAAPAMGTAGVVAVPAGGTAAAVVYGDVVSGPDIVAYGDRTPGVADGCPEPLVPIRLVVLGASTGGPSALARVIGELPADLAVPVLVVQHMASGFLAGFAAWLDQAGPLQVRVGRAEDRLVPGLVTIAPEGCNTLVDANLLLHCQPPGPRQLHVPGIDPTLESVAEALGPAAVGVLLTGMGRDGAVGLGRMRGRGAITLAQDEATSTVFGMPAAAAALGAVDRMLGLHDLAGMLVDLVGRLGPGER
ncbi:MAG: chemotaxis protein CheB [Mycobacteriales bacterium]